VSYKSPFGNFNAGELSFFSTNIAVSSWREKLFFLFAKKRTYHKKETPPSQFGTPPLPVEAFFEIITRKLIYLKGSHEKGSWPDLQSGLRGLLCANEKQHSFLNKETPPSLFGTPPLSVEAFFLSQFPENSPLHKKAPIIGELARFAIGTEGSSLQILIININL
jgi:hypothetical protein